MEQIKKSFEVRDYRDSEGDPCFGLFRNGIVVAEMPNAIFLEQPAGMPNDQVEEMAKAEGEHSADFIANACNAYEAAMKLAEEVDDTWHILHDALKVLNENRHGGWRAEPAIKIINELQELARMVQQLGK